MLVPLSGRRSSGKWPWVRIRDMKEAFFKVFSLSSYCRSDYSSFLLFQGIIQLSDQYFFNMFKPFGRGNLFPEYAKHSFCNGHLSFNISVNYINAF